MTTTVVEARDVALDRLAGSSFTFIPKFLDSAGVEYQPTTVHTKVVLKSTGAEIAALTAVASWTIGDEIVAPGTWTTLVSSSALREDHIVRIIADNGDDAARNELRLIIGCINPER